jgi:hypothetical protein
MSVQFSILTNQNVTLIDIRKKMEDLGKKMKTHVSKISPGLQPRNWPLGKLKSHKDL